MEESGIRAKKEKARKYSRIKYGLSLCETGLFLAFCFIFMAGGVSGRLAGLISTAAGGHRFFSAAAYLTVFLAVYSAVSFPVSFYRSFLLDHQFGLSRQTLKGWFFDRIKEAVILVPVALLGLGAFNILFDKYPGSWWIAFAGACVLFNIAAAYLAPVLIIPMFFRYETIPDDDLRGRLKKLAGSMGVRVMDIYKIDLSKRTSKANAGLAGWGPSKRVILSDTLCEKYTPDEITVITAHEYAHHIKAHIFLLIAAHAVFAFLSVYAIFSAGNSLLGFFGLKSLNEPAAIPLLLSYMVVTGMILGPLGNAFSRMLETSADDTAVRATGLRDAFISSMEKLSDQNLSDRDPPAVLKWLFYDHPPVGERVKRARALRLN